MPDSLHNRWVALLAVLMAPWLVAAAGSRWVQAAEPEALNPFGPVKTDREDAVPGYVELSNGRIIVGHVYLTRDKRLKIADDKRKRQREIPLQKVQQIECKIKKEWMEKEWRFKELALDEKLYTGKVYPAREYNHVITLHDGRKITGQLSELLYVQPLRPTAKQPGESRPDAEPERFLLHKRDKGENGQTLKSLLYVNRVKLGEEALEEGKEKQEKR